MTEPDALARAKRRLLELIVSSWCGKNGSRSEANRAQAEQLALLLGPTTVPQPEQRWADEARWHELHCRAMTPGFQFFTDAENAQIVEMAGRRARYEASAEGKARARCLQLMFKRHSAAGLTLAERKEYRRLDTAYPFQPDPNDPLREEVEYLRKMRREWGFIDDPYGELAPLPPDDPARLN